MGIVQDYKTRREQAERLEGHRNYLLEKARLTAIDATTLDAEGMPDLTKLDDETNAKNAARIAYETLVKGVKKLFKSETDNPLLISQLVNGFAGATDRFFNQYFGSGSKNIREPNSYFGALQEDDNFVRQVQALRSKPLEILPTTGDGIKEVLKYCGITNETQQEKIIPKLYDPRAQAQIIGIFDGNGSLPPKTLEQLLKAA